MADEEVLKRIEERLTRLEAVTARAPVGMVVDPPPWGGGGTPWGPWGGGTIGPRPPWGGTTGDPPPPDFSRLTVTQLESVLHTINAEKARLESTEKQVTAQIAKLRREG